MNATSSKNKFTTPFSLPYQLGIYLAANAVSDSCAVLDGGNCVMPKIDFLAGNHDLRSTLLSPSGAHRVVCTMACPLPQRDNPEKPLLALLNSAAGSGSFAVLLLTGLPFQKLAGTDYAGLAAAVKGRTPVADIPPSSLDADWLEGYALALDALARALPDRKVKKRRGTVALAGYFMDRLEGDHTANIKELRRLLGLCGLELTCVFPDGGSFRDLSRALEAELIVSLPYGRRAAERLARRSGARLLETGLPMGLRGTADWLKAVRLAAGLKGELPPAVRKLEKKAAAAVSPLLDALSHRNVLYAGDPHLFAAFHAFARELRMNVRLALIDASPRPLGASVLPAGLLFAPDTGAALAAIEELAGYRKPDLAVGNSFARTEGFAGGLPFTELGFPSYGHHCLHDEPFFGFAGARVLVCRLYNSLQSGHAA